MLVTVVFLSRVWLGFFFVHMGEASVEYKTQKGERMYVLTGLSTRYLTSSAQRVFISLGSLTFIVRGQKTELPSSTHTEIDLMETSGMGRFFWSCSMVLLVIAWLQLSRGILRLNCSSIGGMVVELPFPAQGYEVGAPIFEPSCG